MDKIKDITYTLDKEYKSAFTDKDFRDPDFTSNLLTDPEIVYIMTEEEKKALAGKSLQELWNMIYISENRINGDVYELWRKLK